MPQPHDTEPRLEALELKIMDLELTLQQLNDVVIGHYRLIERLRRDQTRMQNELDDARAARPDTDSAAEVPPHY